MEKYSTNTSNTVKYSYDNPPAWFYEICREEEEKDDYYMSQHCTVGFDPTISALWGPENQLSYMDCAR